MEEGSLLQEALLKQQQLQQQKESSDGMFPYDDENIDMKNAILLDVYSLEEKYLQDPVRQLIHLAEVGVHCNQFLKSQTYKWHYGGDGPIFGAHMTDGIAHLRAICLYGPNVYDEWMAIHYMIEMSKRLQSIAIACWDVEDGQVILIQTSDVLPEWVDEDSTDTHRHTCWIQHGHIHLFKQSHLTLQGALQQLFLLHKRIQSDSTDDNPPLSQQPSEGLSRTSAASYHPAIQSSLESWLKHVETQAHLLHRTPLVVPRKVAYLIYNRPDLVHAAIQAFCRNIDIKPPISDSTTSSSNIIDCEDWVWTTHVMSRTNYAMARTMVSSEWTTQDYIPSQMMGIELKRYRRQCSVEATPHIRHAVQLGVRIVVGFQFLLSHVATIIPKPVTSPSSSPEQRISYWTRVANECDLHKKLEDCSDNNNPQSQKYELQTEQDEIGWALQKAFRQGPNHSLYNLEPLFKCPVFLEEHNHITLLSHPNTSIRQQIVSAQKQKKVVHNNKENDDDDDDDDEFFMPRAEDVDDESWMVLLDEGQGTERVDYCPESNQDLDGLLSKFQNLLHQSSGVEGISSSVSTNQNVPSEARQRRQRGSIRPRVFMNILHAVLKGGENLSFPTTDPYFFQEDYNLMEKEDDSDNDNDNDAKKDKGMQDLMNAMDAELESKTTSRSLDSVQVGESFGANNSRRNDDENDDVAESAHVLNNLLQSLEASAGAPGPVTNMLKEMDDTIT